MATSPRNPTHAPWLDLRAHKIGDPVERLRFLRREMQVLESEDGGRRRRGWIYAAAVGTLTVIAAGWPTSTTQASGAGDAGAQCGVANVAGCGQVYSCEGAREGLAG